MTEFPDKTYAYQPELASSLTICQQRSGETVGNDLIFTYETYTYMATSNRAQEVH